VSGGIVHVAIAIEPELNCSSVETFKRYTMPLAPKDCQMNVGGFCVVVEPSSGAMGTGVSPRTGSIAFSVQLVMRKRKRNKLIYRLLCLTTPPC
jgi:hypothetical protein